MGPGYLMLRFQIVIYIRIAENRSNSKSFSIWTIL